MTVSYQRYTRSVAAMGGSQQEALDFTEALAKALRLSNATAQETGSVMRQLSQAFNKGKLNGDEFVSVSENGGRVLDYLARQIGKSRGELQEMSKAGALTDQVLLQLGQALDKIRSDFDVLPKNLADAWVNFQNALIDTLGRSAAFQGVMSTLSSAILLVANHIDVLLVALGALGAAWVAAHVSLDLLLFKLGTVAGGFAVATGSVQAFTAALWGLVKHPALIVLGAIVTYLAYDYVAAWLKGEQAQTTALDSLKNQLAEAERKLAALDGAVMRSKQTLEGLFASLSKQYDDIDRLSDESLEGALEEVRRVYDEELRLLKGLVHDKNQARDQETALLIAQVNREYAIVSQASARKLALIRQEYTQAMDLARKTSIVPELRMEREEAAQKKLLAKLKETWEQEAAGYENHLKAMEDLALGHLNRIQELERERAEGSQFIDDTLAEIDQRAYDASRRLFAEKKSQEQEIAALKARIAQGDMAAMKELTKLYSEQAQAAKQASQGRILQQDERGVWLAREDLALRKQINEINERYLQGKDEQIRKENEARVAAQAQIETMKELVTQSRELAQAVTVSMEQMAKMKIGVDSETFQAELDKLVDLVNQRDDAKLRVQLVSDQIDALKVTEQVEGALANQPIKAPVEFDLRDLLDKDLDEVIARVKERNIPVAVTPEVQDAGAVVTDLTQDLANHPATAPVNIKVNADEVTHELAKLKELKQEQAVWVQVRAGTEQAIADLSAFQALVASTQSTHTIVTNAQQALLEILSLNGRNTYSTHTIYVRRVESDATGGLVGLAHGGSPVFPRRRGYILGPGSETSDRIPAMLSRGEYVLRAAAVRHWGLGFLEALNRGFMPPLPRYALGGPVPSIPASPELPEMAINLSIQGGAPLRVLSSRETARHLTQALRDLQRGR